MSGFGAARAAAYDSVARQAQRSQLLGMGAYERHKRMMADLARFYGAAPPEQPGAAGPERTDFDILRENYRFIRTETDDSGDAWEVRLAKRYYARLFREFAIADLSRHKEGRVGMRWRTQREVVQGKGQFVCGAKGCDERRGLASFEVPFAYEEAGERRQALVKLRVCPDHAFQLNYRKHKEAEEEAARREERRRERRSKSGGKRERGADKGRGKRRRRERGGSGGGSEGEGEQEREEVVGGSEGRRGSGKRRRGEGPGGASGGVSPPPAAAAAAAPGDEFEDFFQGLFE